MALVPADSPANGVAIPAIGCLPSAKKITAPSGGNTTYPASLASDDIIPANTNPAVIKDLGIAKINHLNAAEINTDRSAYPITSIVVSTTPNGANLLMI